MTAATAHTRWLKKLARDTERQRRERARKHVRAALAHKRTARARARAACKKARVRFARWKVEQRKRLKLAIQKLRAKMKAERVRRRAKVAACCGPDRAAVRRESDARIAAARAELRALETERRRERAWTAPSSTKPSASSSRRTKRAESDHEVTVNLTPDELIVWQRVGKTIHATDRMSRTEAFAHWMHEHSGDVARILADDAEQAYRRAVRDEIKQRRELAHTGTRTDRQLAAYVSRALSDVPF
jgi:hypothetical protein